MTSSKRNCSGPPTSTMPFTGVPTATRPTAAATSSAAIGWNRTDGVDNDIGVGRQAGVFVLDRQVGRDGVVPSRVQLRLDQVPVPAAVCRAMDECEARHARVLDAVFDMHEFGRALGGC